MTSPLQKKLEIISLLELEKQITHSKNQAINKKACECEKEGQCSLENITQEEEIGEIEVIEYEETNLTNLVHVNNRIN